MDVAVGQASREAGGMRFLRQLGVASLVIALAVGLTVLVDHLASGPLAGSMPQGRRIPVKGPHGGVIVIPPGGHLPANIPAGATVVHLQGGFDLGLGSMFQPENWPPLRHTVVIEVGVLAAVVVLDLIRRKWRRARRARQS
jgi:hypothetical protein